MTSETYYGVLKGGVVFRNVGPSCFKYAAEEAGYKFEVAVGGNGWGWVRGDGEIERGVGRVEGGGRTEAEEVWGRNGKRRRMG